MLTCVHRMNPCHKTREKPAFAKANLEISSIPKENKYLLISESLRQSWISIRLGQSQNFNSSPLLLLFALVLCLFFSKRVNVVTLRGTDCESHQPYLADKPALHHCSMAWAPPLWYHGEGVAIMDGPWWSISRGTSATREDTHLLQRSTAIPMYTMQETMDRGDSTEVFMAGAWATVRALWLDS